MPGGISREDIEDVDIVDAIELASDGTTVFVDDATVVSTTASTKRIVLSGVDLIYDKDERVEVGDIIILSGTSGADGTYTVSDIIDQTTLEVSEAIADSTGGTADLIHPSGASKVGLDPSNVSGVTATEMQTAMEQLSAATGADDKKVQVNGSDASYDYLLAKLQAGSNITLTAVDIGGGVLQVKIDASGTTDWTTHRTLRHLIHFIEEGPAEGFTSGAYREQLPSGGIFPTSVTWWESSSKLKKIVERLITWAGVNATQDKWKIYDTDGSTVLWTITDAISYSGIVETTRTRTITSGDA